MSDPNPYASPQVETPQPRDRWTSEGPNPMRRAIRGLSLVHTGFTMVVFCRSVAFLVDYLFFFPGAQLARFGVFVGLVLTFVGTFCCATVPERTKLRGVVTGAIGLQWFGFLATIFGRSAWSSLLMRSGPILWLLAVALLAVFMGRLARHVGHGALQRRARLALISLWVLTGLCACIAAMYFLPLYYSLYPMTLAFERVAPLVIFVAAWTSVVLLGRVVYPLREALQTPPAD